MLLGELALDGSVRPVKGVLSMAMAARDLGIKKLLVPAANAREAAVVAEVTVFGASSLGEAAGILSGQLRADPVTVRLEELSADLNTYDIDFPDKRTLWPLKSATTSACLAYSCPRTSANPDEVVASALPLGVIASA